MFINRSSKDVGGEDVKVIGQPEVYIITINFIYLRYLYASQLQSKTGGTWIINSPPDWDGCCADLVVEELDLGFRAIIKATEWIWTQSRSTPWNRGYEHPDGEETLTNHAGEGRKEYPLSSLIFYVCEAHLEFIRSFIHSLTHSSKLKIISVYVW